VLKTTPTGLIEEIQAACKARDEHLEQYEAMLARYHGPYYRQADQPDDYSPENSYYQYISVMVPRLVYDNPRVRVQSRRGGPNAQVAQAIRHGLNRWVRDYDLRKHLAEIAVDMLFSWGVMLVREETRKGVTLPGEQHRHGTRATWPITERIPQRKFLMDPGATRWQDARWYGHEWKRDKDDLLKLAEKEPDQGWNADAIKALSYSRDEDQKYGKDQDYPDRNEIRCYEIYVPEVELDESPGHDQGFYGTIFTIGVNQSISDPDVDEDDIEAIMNSAEFIRKPRPFYGPRQGPYVLFGVYKVPDSPWPLGPLTAVEGQITDLNEHVTAASIAMQKHKRIIGVNDPRTAQLVKDLQSDYVAVVPFEDGKALVQQFEMGGHTDHQNEWIAQSRNRMERNLGMDEALAGNVTGEGTATEHTIASGASSTRISYVKQAFADATRTLLQHVAFYMYHSDTITFPLGADVAGQLGLPAIAEPWFRGGTEDIEDGFSFEDLELEIEPYSMERTNEGLAQKRALETHSLILNTLPMMQAFPDFPWQEHFRKLGDSLNLPDLGELVTPELLQRLATDLQTQQQSQAQVSSKQNLQPMLRKHLGQANLSGGVQAATGNTGSPGLQSGTMAGGAIRQ
jgi:hypothetical protein